VVVAATIGVDVATVKEVIKLHRMAGRSKVPTTRNYGSLFATSADLNAANSTEQIFIPDPNGS